MKATISKKNESLFSPFFRTVIGSEQVSVSLKDFLNNPRKYINTGISYLYENEEELRKYLAKSGTKSEPVILNMEKANRGKAFETDMSEEVANEAAKIVKERIRRRKRLEDKFKRKQKQAKEAAAENKAKEAKEAKVAADAKKKAEGNQGDKDKK